MIALSILILIASILTVITFLLALIVENGEVAVGGFLFGLSAIGMSIALAIVTLASSQ